MKNYCIAMTLLKTSPKVSPFHFLYFTFASKYDFYNLKLLLNLNFKKKEVPEELISKVYTIEPRKLISAIYDEKYEEIPGSFKLLIKK